MESLDLSHNPISIAGATDLAKCLHNVQSLNIDRCEFDDVRFEKVASYLRTTNNSVIIFINAKYKNSKTIVGLSLKHIYWMQQKKRRNQKKTDNFYKKFFSLTSMNINEEMKYNSIDCVAPSFS